LTASPLYFLCVDCVSPLCFESTACPLPSVGCLYAPTFFRRLCVTASPPTDYTTTTPGSLEHLRSLEYHANLEQRVYHPSLYRLLHLLPSVCRLLVRVDYLSYCQLYRPAMSITKASSTSEVSSTIQPRTACLPSLLVSLTPPSTICVSTTSPRVDYSLYQHLSEIQCAVQDIFNERVMDRGYLGDVGRRTVMRSGTVDPKRPAVAILAMHPRSLDSSWRG